MRFNVSFKTKVGFIIKKKYLNFVFFDFLYGDIYINIVYIYNISIIILFGKRIVFILYILVSFW